MLVGASLGGNASLAALGHQPELALGLVLVDVSPFLPPKGTSRIRDFMTGRPEGFASLEEAADAVAAYLPHRPRPRNVEGLRKNLREVDGRFYWHWDPALLKAPADQAVQRNSLTDPATLGAAAMSLRVPTLLVRGGESDVLSVEDSRRFLELVPHAEFAVGCEHGEVRVPGGLFPGCSRQHPDPRRHRIHLGASGPSVLQAGEELGTVGG